MAQANKRLGQLRLRAPRPGDLSDTAPLPIYHHPLVSISLILIVASLGQICVWLLRMRLVNTPTVASSTALVHGWLYEFMIDHLMLRLEGISGFDTIVFLVLLAIGMLSTIAWYAAVRLAFGPAWGLAVALAWAVHPGFALLVQKPSALAISVLLIPASLALLFWWKTSRHRIWIAPLVGASMALATLSGSFGVVLLPAIVLSMCFAGQSLFRRLISVLLCLAVYAAIIIPWWDTRLTEPQRMQLRLKMGYDLWSSVQSGDKTPMALAADRWVGAHPHDKVPSPTRFLLNQAQTSPAQLARWLLARSIDAMTATSDGRFKRPLWVLQLLTCLPGVWGCLVALRYPPWRWAAWVGLSSLFVIGLLTALAEPLARNFAPVGGIGVAFMFIGVADLYERIFGRRLTPENPIQTTRAGLRVR